MAKDKRTIAKFIPPHSDKSWSFQIVFPTNKDLPISGEFVHLMNTDDDVKAAKPFLQGHSGNWAMVEFWVKEEEIALKAAQKFADHFKVELGRGDFTTQELGI